MLLNLSVIEREISDESGGRWFLTRILPYRTMEDQVAGVVLTLVDITESKRSAAALRVSEAELAAELRAMECLHALTKRLLQTPDLLGALGGFLKAAVDLHRTELGASTCMIPSRRCSDSWPSGAFLKASGRNMKSSDRIRFRPSPQLSDRGNGRSWKAT